MTVDLGWQDLLPFAPNITPEQADALITGTLARAAEVAPCILEAGFTASDAARDIIIAGVLRRFQTQGGMVTTQTVGPYSVTVDNRALAGQLFPLSEIAELQAMCRTYSGVTRAAVPTFSMPDCPPDWPDPAEVRWWVPSA